MLRYADHLDTLVALASYLALAPDKHYSASKLSENLSLNQREVERVLDDFLGVFRKTKNPKGKRQEFRYTLHLRYARRNGELDKPLPSELVSQLLAFLHDRAYQEEQSRAQRRSNYVAVGGALVAAIAAIVAAFIATR